MNKVKVGKFIAMLRNEHNLTQEQLAEKLNISSYKTISKWECGNALPDIETFEELSKEFNVSLYELSIGEKVEKNKLHLKDIPQYISDKQIKKLKAKTKIKYLLLLILGIISILSIIFTINNYNTTQVYTIESDDENYYVEGNLIHTKKESILTINNISYLGSDKKLMEQQVSNYETYLQIDNNTSIYFNNKNIKNNIVKDIINNTIFSSNDEMTNIINEKKLAIFYFQYTTKDNIHKKISIKLKLTKNYSNDKLI